MAAARTDSLLASLPVSITTPEEWTAALDSVLAAFECQTGTIHRIDSPSGLLTLLAQRGIPPFLLDKVQSIPVGKGIAGCAAGRREPVQLCNIQTDDSGVVRPEARKTQVEGALAVPIFRDGAVAGVIGIGKMRPYDFSADEIRDLEATAAALAASL